jgi:hypothetical protein
LATSEAVDALARDGYAFHDTASMLSLSRAEIERYGPVRFEVTNEGVADSGLPPVIAG